MEITDCYNLGRITKPWGIKGQMAVYLDVDCPADYLELDSALVEIKGQLVPHFFHIDNLNGNRAVVTFDGMTAAQTAALAGHELYLPLDRLPKLDGNRFYFHEVIGFDVVDSQHGAVGRVDSFIESPAQPIMSVLKEGTEILIPVIDQVIKRVDREHRTIFIEAPNGLIELYMG